LLRLPLEKPRFHEALEGYVAFVLQNGNLTRSHYLPPQPSKGRRATSGVAIAGRVVLHNR